MKTHKKKLKLGLFIVLTLLIILGVVVYPLLRGACGYSAKMVCSSVFIEGLSQERVEQMELTAFPFNWITNKVDIDRKMVTSTILGFASQTAVYQNKLGATLYPNDFHQIPSREPYPKVDADSLLWPMGSILIDSLPSGVDIEGLKAYIKEHFNETSRALVVVWKGQLLAEHYMQGINKYTPLLGWSMTKSLTGTLTGILVKNGYLDIHQPVDIPQWRDDQRSEITLNNLLQMSSGLHWKEDYSTTSVSDVTEMLYLRSDMPDYACTPELDEAPDSSWLYSSGTTNIISGLMRAAIDDYQSYYQLPQKALFNKLGMNHSLIETDASGNFVGSSYGYCSARDWARLGMLYLNNGNWYGEQILPKWWVSYCTTPARQSNGEYGAQLWLNYSQKHLPDMPSDVYFFKGYRGQRVVIVPSHQMVVVCLNSSVEAKDFNTYLSTMLNFFKPISD